ncbi:MAG: alanine racemase [Patescibacteria group bacterium]
MQNNKLPYKTWLEIDRDALLSNITTIEKHIDKNIVCMAIIKANAYGHGFCEVAQVLRAKKNIWLGVDSLDEALVLKKLGMSQPIMILGYIPPSRLLEALRANFRVSVYNLATLKHIVSLLKTHRSVQPHLHLKIETGTNRLGLQLKDLAEVKHFPLVEGIYTHFADAENSRSIFYKKQLRVLKKAIWILKQKSITPHFVHAASSAALLVHPKTHLSLVRLGISLYGLWPSDDVKYSLSNKIKLRPVLTWKTCIAQIKEISKRETVGYDRTWMVKQKSKIAILPVGYYDGYDRKLSNCGEVLINGNLARVIGRVCMNMMMVDITGISANENDEIVLLGKSGNKEITADDIAKKIGTINYEIVSRINTLIPRIII